MSPRLLGRIGVVLAVLASPTLGADPDSLATLAAEIRSRWPQRGVVVAEYADEFGNHHATAWDFASGSWFFDNGKMVTGIDAQGAYSGILPGRLERAGTPIQTGFESRLDAFFPQMFVVGISQRGDIVKSAQRRAEGGWRVMASLPRGSREFTIEELGNISAPEIERWGGAEKIHREVEVLLSESLDVESIRVEGQHAVGFDRSANSPPGFQVVSACEGPLEGMRLVRVEFAVGAKEDGLSMVGVEREALARRGPHPERSPVPSPGASPARPARRSNESTGVGSNTWIVAGCVVLVVGVGLLLRRRAAGA